VPHLRIWDVEPALLCRSHLLGEHRELHAVWNIHTLGRRGYSRHPETLRWKGKLKALRARHEALVREMDARGYSHRSELDSALASGRATQDAFVDAPGEQVRIIRSKGCDCRV